MLGEFFVRYTKKTKLMSEMQQIPKNKTQLFALRCIQTNERYCQVMRFDSFSLNAPKYVAAGAPAPAPLGELMALSGHHSWNLERGQRGRRDGEGKRGKGRTPKQKSRLRPWQPVWNKWTRGAVCTAEGATMTFLRALSLLFQMFFFRKIWTPIPRNINKWKKHAYDWVPE